MKETWKKTCNGKVVITLNNDENEKASPTEVEVPVDLNWTSGRIGEKRFSASKAVIVMGVVLVLGLTIVTLFKVQNLIYSTSYVNWRVQELESAVSDSNDDLKLVKYKLDEFMLDEKSEEISRGARAEPLVASIGNAKTPDTQDLKLSESQNQNHKLNTINMNVEAADAKKETEVPSSSKAEPMEPKENKKDGELNDARDHPNPSDPEEWIKPLVETFDIFGNQPIEDQFIHNVLMKLLMPENNVEVLELNKMHENQEQQKENKMMMMNLRPNNNNERPMNRPLPPQLESILMKTLLPPMSNFKVFHFNERPEQQQQQNSMEEEMPPKMVFQTLKVKPMLPPIEGLVKSLLPPGNMKFFNLNERQEQSAEEDTPKITIQSIKLKLVPLEEFQRREPQMNNHHNNNNFEVIRLNESPEPSQEVEAPKMMPLANFNPFPFPIHDMMKMILPSSKHIEIVPLNERPEDQQQSREQQEPDMSQQERFNPLPIPLQDIITKMLPPGLQSQEMPYNNQESQEQQHPHPDVEITKIPVRTMKINPFPLPIPEALMKSMLPVPNYGEPMINITDQQQQQQQPQQHEESQQAQQQQEVPRAMPRSTKLNPVEEAWDMSPPPQYPAEPAQN